MRNDFSSVEDVLSALRQGRMIILVDDEERENEGDLVLAAEFVTPEAINFMSKFGRGLICLPMTSTAIEKLRLPMMTSHNRSPYETAFTVSIEAATGVSTGISAKDRAHTIKVAIDAASTSNDIITPGHIFPLAAKPHGVLERRGQTEGSIDLMRIANLKPAAVICEIMNDNGEMSRYDDLVQFSKTHQIPMISVAALVDYRLRHEIFIKEIAAATLPLMHKGQFKMRLFANIVNHAEYVVLTKPLKHPQQPPLVRIHSECLTGDIFGSARCDCGEQLQQSLDMIDAEGGILIYLKQEGRGIGLANKLKAYHLQDEQGLDTVEANLHLGFPADDRDYAMAFQILKVLNIKKLRLITNNPKKINSLMHFGLEVVARIPLIIPASILNQRYLQTKKEKLGHLLESIDR